MGRLLLLLALALSVAALATSPPAEAHDCVGTHCGDCDGPGNHDHSSQSGDTRTACTSQGQLIPTPGAPLALAALLAAAVALAAIRASRRRA